MKYSPKIAYFIILQVILVLIYVYKESTFVRLLYEQQKTEKFIEKLAASHKELIHQLENIKKNSSIRSFALQHLNLRPINLHAIHRLYDQ